MLIQEKSFDGYIGVIAVFDPKKVIDWSQEKVLIPVNFYWCPVRKSKGRMIPHWDEMTLIGDFHRCGYFVPKAYAGSSESIEMFIREECSTLLDEVESHFCRTGQCKINANHCPERKVS